jgi:hypothetical protein
MFSHIKIEQFRPSRDIRMETITKIFGLGKTYHNNSWVALITGLDDKYTFARDFLSPKTDYSDSNSKGSRGIYLNFFLNYGHIYEVSAQKSWRSIDKYFLHIDNQGVKKIMNKEEVIKCLKKDQ